MTELAKIIAQKDAEIADLKAQLWAARQPTWFYAEDYEQCCFSVDDVIDAYDLLPGKHVIEVPCARALPDIHCAVHIFSDAEREARHDDDRWIYSEHETEAAAISANAEETAP